jgi:hypothetical protein
MGVISEGCPGCDLRETYDVRSDWGSERGMSR